MNRRSLPHGVVEGRRTPTFDESSTPPALRSAHHTTVWAELVVEAGEVVFVEEASGEETTVPAGSRHVIVPGERHAVRLRPGARFHVQFWD